MMTSVDTDLLRVLAHPLRLQIVTVLAKETLCSTHLIEETGATPSHEPQPTPGATPPRKPLTARAAAELLGTALLVAVVIGSGIQATELTKDVGVQLLANSIATVFGLGILILLFGPVSGAHF